VTYANKTNHAETAACLRHLLGHLGITVGHLHLQSNGQIRTKPLARLVKRNVLNAVRVTLQCAFKLAGLIVPDLVINHTTSAVLLAANTDYDPNE